MKCSDCRRWETEGCINPEKKDLDHAETFVCFDLKEGPIKEAKKWRDRAATIRTIGLILIPITVLLYFGAVGSAMTEDTGDTLMVAAAFGVLATIAFIASIVLLITALVFHFRCKKLKRQVDSPKREETRG